MNIYICIYIYPKRKRETERERVYVCARERYLLGWRYFWSQTRPATAITTAITCQPTTVYSRPSVRRFLLCKIPLYHKLLLHPPAGGVLFLGRPSPIEQQQLMTHIHTQQEVVPHIHAKQQQFIAHIHCQATTGYGAHPLPSNYRYLVHQKLPRPRTLQ